MSKKGLIVFLIILVLMGGCTTNANTDVQYETDKLRPIITWVDDDGQAGFYQKLKPFVLEYNIPFTSAVITSRKLGGKFMTLEQMNEMVELGCEIVSHAHTHNKDYRPAQMTEEELRLDFQTSKQIIEEWGFSDHILVYPFGSENDTVRKVAAEFFDFAVDTWNSNGPIGNVVSIPFEKHRIERVSAQREDIKEIYEKMDEAVKNHSWIILVSHVDQGSWYSEERVRSLIDYALEAGLEFVTLEEGFSRMQKYAE
jgi:peptidoglycan/xylan/chitin deacetylase (PgdA/CDA1 family)